MNRNEVTLDIILARLNKFKGKPNLDKRTDYKKGDEVQIPLFIADLLTKSEKKG